MNVASPVEAGHRHLIVGIGASAGGLAALRALLGRLPPDPPFAMVLVQHLGLGEEALLAEVLAGLSPVPVEIGTDGALPAVGCLTVAPAGRVVKLQGGVLRVREARSSPERRGLIDRFLRSLAEDAGECAVGVILSGAGADGATGLQAIAAAGGLTMAQSGDSAQRPDMPDAAALSGHCDEVLPPERLADALIAYARHIRDLPDGGGMVERHRAVHAALPRVAELLKAQTGADFRHYKTTTLMRRIERRMQVLRLSSAEAYVDRIEADPAEAQTLFRELLIGVTAFFRDADAFEALVARVIAPLLHDRSPSDELRIWVPGCATGEEAYTIAMLVTEAIERAGGGGPRVQIFATDLNERALGVARRGSYPPSAAAQIGPERLARFFTKRGRRYHVAPSLREMCLFTQHNLVSDPPFSRLDLVSCRNLLIYLGQPLQKKIIPVFHYALKPGGYLFLGGSESLTGHGELFRTIDARHRIAQRKETRSPDRLPPRPAGGPGATAQGALRGIEAPADADLGEVARRILLAEFAPRYAIVNEEGHAVYLSEGVERYLQPPAGTFSNAIVRMARRGLSAPLRGALSSAVRTRRATMREVPAVQTAEGPRRVRLTVQTMPELGHGEGLFMAVFEDLGAAARPRETARADAEALIETLERDLERAREELERSLQSQEAASEELKASNEELLSMNEELQSANEELEASKEEVQAANAALAGANADLENLLRSTQIATVFLDADGAIRSFTPAAAAIYAVRDGDVGRPLAEISCRIDGLPPLPAPAAVGPEGEEATAQASDGRWYLRRVLPYSGPQGAAGLVVSFIDISGQKAVENELRDAQDRAAAQAAELETLYREAPVGMGLYDRDLRFLRLNDTLAEINGIPAAESIGRTVAELLPDIAPIIAPLYARIFATGEPVVGLTITGETPKAPGVVREWIGSYHPLRGPDGTITAVSAIVQEVTEQRAAERRLAESEALYRTLIEVSPQVVWRSDPQGFITFANDYWYAYSGQVARPLGHAWLDAIDPPARDRIASAWVAATATGGEWNIEIPFVRADGAVRRHMAIGRPVHDEAGAIIEWVGIAVDIEDLKRAEEEALRTAETLRIIGDSTPDFIFAKDRQSRTLFANKPLLARIGKAEGEILGRTEREWLDNPAEAEALLAADRQVMESGEALVVDERVTLADGIERVFRSTKAPLRDAGGEVIGVVGITTDMSAERARSALIAASEASLQLALDVADMAGWTVELPSLAATHTEQMGPLVGRARGETVFADVESGLSFLHPDDRERVTADARAQIEARGRFEIEARIVREDGRPCWVALRGRIEREDGEVRRLTGVVRDIDERKRAEEKLAVAAAQFRALADAMPQLAWIAHADGYIHWYNRRWHDYTGTTPEQMEGWGWQSVHHPDTLPRVMEEWTGAIARGEPFDTTFPLRGADGVFRDFLTRAEPVRDPQGRVLQWFGTNTDVSAMTELTRSLQASEAQFRSLAESMPALVFMTDPDGRNLFVNRRYAAYTGIPAEALTGDGWHAVIHPDDWGLIDALPLVRDADGVAEQEVRLRGADGGYRWFLLRANRVKSLGYTIGTAVDIDDRRRLEESLRDAAEAKEALLHEVNHRVKNSLQLITSLLALQMGQTRDPEARAVLAEARGRIGVVANLHQRLYSASQHDRMDFGPYLAKLAEDTVSSIGDGRIRLSVDAPPGTVLKLNQAVPLSLIAAEMLTNAVKYAFPDGRPGTLAVAVRHHLAGVSAGFIEVEVADDGIGMPEGFEPTRGTGLGTRIIAALARQLRATVRVDSAQGTGTRFTVVVPAQDEEGSDR